MSGAKVVTFYLITNTFFLKTQKEQTIMADSFNCLVRKTSSLSKSPIYPT